MNKENELTGSSAAGRGSDWTHNSGFSLFAIYWGKYVYARLQVLSTSCEMMENSITCTICPMPMLWITFAQWC